MQKLGIPRLLLRSNPMDVSLTKRQDRYCGPKIDATWHGLWGCNGFAAQRAIISSKNHAVKAGIFRQDTVYSPSNDPAVLSANIKAHISTAERKERGIPKV